MIGLKNMAEMCRRIGVITRAGVGLVDAIKREAGRQRDQRMWSAIVLSLDGGNSLAVSLKPFTRQFGEMFIAMIETGEDSGHLSEMFVELSEYYEDLLRIRRDFLRSLIMPLIELVAAVVIVGFIILLLGLVSEMAGQTIDILGFGLIGFRGFVLYWVYVGIVCVSYYVVFLWIRRSVSRMRIVHYFLNRIPRVGVLMRSLAFMRLCWGLDLTMRTGMDVERALMLSFNGTNYAPVSDNLPKVLEVIRGGGDLTDAFSVTKNIDYDLIAGVETGENSGSLPELMQKMKDRYFQESLTNLRAVSVVGGFIVYGLIMALIVFLIFRVASFYIGILNDAAQMAMTIT
ncbi:MAG: type II secretion system F family protein [Planctomycetaceae bacterium]|jgi:type IV pilus assembly protein PilC|nr:type II secretion system F family protein [Planctomycetaceae bacterium]